MEVVVALLLEQSLQTKEIRGLNPNKAIKIKKEARKGPIFE